MKNVQKGFTLVELIVVITILAILGTIAFISLQGYSQDAKNSKITSDIRSLTSAIETKVTSGDIAIKDLVSTTVADNSADDDTRTFGSVSFGGTGVVIDDTAVTGNYNVGTLDFIALGQNDSDFNYDDKGTERAYLVAYAAQGDVAYYQIAGHVSEASGDYKAVVKGNYVNEGGINDTAGLVADATNSTPVENETELSTTGLY